MVDPKKKAWLDEMTWEEAKDAFKKTDVAVICLGSTHGHGVAAPLGTDTFVADGIGQRVGMRSNVVVLRTIPYGWNEYHMDFPGTINVSRQHLYDLYSDICDSLYKWGIRKIVWLSPHGGNASVIEDLSYKLRYEKGVLSAKVGYGHAGQVKPELSGFGSEGMVDEAAMMLYLKPETAHPERPKWKDYKNPFGPNLKCLALRTWQFGPGTVEIYNTSKDITDECGWGNTPK